MDGGGSNPFIVVLYSKSSSIFLENAGDLNFNAYTLRPGLKIFDEICVLYTKPWVHLLIYNNI